MTTNDAAKEYDIILIGAGIMSATLATLLKTLNPKYSIAVYEKLPAVAQESSAAWNNAGTGHAALCELNYTTENVNKTFDISKAVTINKQFQISKQFWAYLCKTGYLNNPTEFINKTPHMSWVTETENVNFLQRRHETMQKNPFFSETKFSTNQQQISQWAPLLTVGRDHSQPIAASYNPHGTDINFGTLTQKLFTNLQKQNVKIFLQQEVKKIYQTNQNFWTVETKNLSSQQLETKKSKFVFIAAGGNALTLLQKSGIPAGKNIAGFPISGRFLKCNNPNIINQHHTKVYGKPAVGAPPMSMPHLDKRIINGKPELLFGPFAGFSPKFLKTGSNLDLFASIKKHNLKTMLTVGATNIPLTKYLLKQLLLSKNSQMDELRKFFPNAQNTDWDLITAGQRVQVMKKNVQGKSVLQFGTELVTNPEGTLAALLGASPGASISVQIILDLLEKCFPEELAINKVALQKMVPSYNNPLANEKTFFEKTEKETNETLNLL